MRRRKGESEGPRLTPGERAINWAKALAIIVPLFGAGYISNSEIVKTLVAPEVEEKPEIVEVDREPISCPEIDLTPLKRMIEKRCSLSNHEKEFHQ